MRRTKLRVAVAVAVAGAMVLAGCGQQPTAKSSSSGADAVAGGNLQMWIAGNAVTTPIYQGEVKAYSKAHPGTTISLTDLPGSAYTQKLDVALAAGKTPAIYEVYAPGQQLDTLAKEKKLTDLTGFLASEKALRSRIIPSTLSQAEVNGRAYGIPYNIFQEAVVLYDKPDFAKAGIAAPPTTWSGLQTDMAKLKKAGVIPVSISGTESDNWYSWWLENYEVHLAGLGVYNALRRGDFSALDSKPVIETATAMQALVRSGAFEPGFSTESETNDVPYALLGTGKAAMILYGAFTPNFVGDVSPSFLTKREMGWFSFPSVGRSTAKPAVDLSSIPMLVVNNDMSKARIRAAEQFLSAFVYSSSQVRALAQSGNVGPAAEGASVVAAAAPKDLRSYMEFELHEALDSPSAFAGWDNLVPTAQTDTWNSLLEELFTLKVTPASFAQQAARL